MLSTETALRKDRNAGYAYMQHRHFATIAAIISELEEIAPETHETVANYFAARLAQTNPRFDRDRFLRACGV